MLPLLNYAGDEKEHSLREAIDALAEHFGLTDEERDELLPSGQQAVFDNRVGWARTYFTKAGLLESPRRAHFTITDRGLKVLADHPLRIDINYLNRYPEFVEFHTSARAGKTPSEQSGDQVANETQTPEEVIETAYQKLRRGLAADLLQTIKEHSPAFFERLVVDLLVRMGYGGTRRDAGAAIGRSGDEGIDGIINEDRLGLDVVYIQAKRWDTAVSRPEIQKFAGALAGQRASKGIFMTTSSFTQAAREYVSLISSKIVLIDGDTLAQLMIDFGVGVAPVAAYELKRIDSDYFSEE